MQPTRRGALGLVAALGLVLGACTATVPGTQGSADRNDGVVTATGGAGAVPARVGALRMQDVSAALGATEDVEVHVVAEVTGMGRSLPAMRFTTVTDHATGRFTYRSEPVEAGGSHAVDRTAVVPGYEMIGDPHDDGLDLYLRADGEHGWVRIVIDRSLTGEVEVFHDPRRILDSFQLTDLPGIVFDEAGTGSHAGQTMTRQVATLDLADLLLGAVPPGSPDEPDSPDELLRDLFDSTELDAFLPTGTIEVLVDDDATPRRVDIELALGGAGGDEFSGAMRTTMTIDPAPGGGISVPAADTVTETVTVDSLEDLAEALGASSSALAWN